MVTVYATRNTEYHLRGDLCVAVRDRETLAWASSSQVLGQRVTCMVVSIRGQLRRHTLSPRIGSSLWFESVQAMTSSIRVIRPATSEEVAAYPSLAGPARAERALEDGLTPPVPLLVRRTDQWLEQLPPASRQVLEEARSTEPAWSSPSRTPSVVLRPVIDVGAPPRRPLPPPSGETRL
ncbi:MAG: hypothetical protein KF901_26245 [Myxococcales bacterium]|nr:hypothetical protein [Myxococcales bacterium]